MAILAQVREAVGRLDPSETREAAERPVSLRLRASTSAGYAAIEDFLTPRLVSRRKRFELAGRIFRAGDAGAPGRVDLDIVEVGFGGEPAEEDTWFVFDPERPGALVHDILAEREDLGLALARMFPPFREPVIEKVVHSVARENAVFSLTTSLPALAPSLPVQMPDISDTAFMTVNQIRMAFLLAAASDRPAGYREQRTEIGAIVAGAFGWRALARRLGGRFSWGNGVIPRAALAYAGTYLAGRALERLYRTGYGMTREERSLAYGDALAKGRQVASAVLQAWRDREGERRYRQASSS